jgi:putative inorganic carbon (hco3(-)) transporter
MDFALFVVLNAVLLIRPEELLPEIAGLRLYLIAITGCLLTAGARLVTVLQPAELARRPITVCVLAVWAAGALSQVVRGQIGLAIEFATEFGKVVLYYLLLISVLDTPNRIRAFLTWIVVFVVVISGLGLLRYHGVIDFAVVQVLERKHSTADDEETVILQLQGTGIYSDPNDLCLILVTAALCALFRSVSAGSLIGRMLWLSPVALFGYAVNLTQSRGGVLGLGLAFLTSAYERLGWRKTLVLTVAMAPAGLLVGGRQGDISLSKGDTAHQRVELWSGGLIVLMTNPVTGIGVGRYPEEVGLVAHNSFVHAYVEEGLLGGTAFLGAFALAAAALHRTSPVGNPTLTRMRPFVLAMAVGYAGGAFSVSRNYVVPTYMVLGLCEAFLRLSRTAAPQWFRFDGRMILGLVGVGVAGLIGLKVVTQMLLSVG